MKQLCKTQTCAHCQESFSITPEDFAYYQRIKVPEPTWCPLCRHLRRHGHINDYVFYTRPCDHCKTSFVSIFPPQSEYVVFCQRCWYSEDRNDKAEGRPYDFSRPFFEQFDQLMHATPQLGIIGRNNENCDYCQSVANSKNCYLISESSNCEDCYYCYWIQKTKDCLDCSFTHQCELCYHCVDCFDCYNLQYSRNCSQCYDALFLDNCRGCKNCFFCTNLRQKEYYIRNKPCSKDQYFSELKQLLPTDWEGRGGLEREFEKFLRDSPRRQLQQENTENCCGDYIRNAKNCRHVFHCYDAEDCAYGEHVWRGAKDCVDANTAGRNAELIYESTNSGIDSYDVKFSRYCWGSHHTEYSNQCKSGRYLFGCVSLKQGASYCILNKEYRAEDYFSTVEKIKGQMRRAGEYGEFFPLALALFGYNNSVSFTEFPFSEKEVRKKGWKWEFQASGTRGQGTLNMENLRQDITQTEDSLCQEVLTCTKCARNYKLIAQELAFYRAQNIPIPKLCPFCRHEQRLSKRNKKQFSVTPCAQCATEITTTLDTNEYPKIICEQCYQVLVSG